MDNGREGPVVADISPYPAGDGLQFRQDLDGRVVGMDAPGAKDMSPDRLIAGLSVIGEVLLRRYG